MTLFDLGVFIVGVANLAGVALLLKWISALKGTVAAQEMALKTLSGLNATVLEIIKALDPERWAKEVQIHKRLADEKAAAIVEDERTKRRRDVAELTEFAFAEARSRYSIILRLLPYVPKLQRADLITDPGVMTETRDQLLQAAEQFPDLSFTGRASRVKMTEIGPGASS